MKKLLILILFLSLPLSSYAGICVDHVGEVVIKIEKGSSPNRCNGEYFTNEDSEFVELMNLSTPVKFLRYDSNIVVGSPVVEKSQAEKDAIIAAEEQAAEDAANVEVDKLRVDMKDALTALVKVYNSKVPAQYQMTKQEIIDQIKQDRGITP